MRREKAFILLNLSLTTLVFLNCTAFSVNKGREYIKSSLSEEKNKEVNIVQTPNLLIDSFSFKDLNPYRKYFALKEKVTNSQQLLRQSAFIGKRKKDASLEGKIPDLLLDVLPSDFFIGNIHSSVYVKKTHTEKEGKDLTIVCFTFELLPSEEILEHIAYPGISSVFVIDETANGVLFRYMDLPFLISDFDFSNKNNYLLISHLPFITDQNMYEQSDYWVNHISLYKGNNEKPCYTLASDKELFLERDKNTDYLYFSYYSEDYGRGDLVETSIVENTLYSLTYKNLFFTRNEQGADVNGVFYSFKKDFRKEKIEC